jgi:hypothetical protein
MSPTSRSPCCPLRGMGDFTYPRQHAISYQNYLEHAMKWEGRRFARHHTFHFIVLNTLACQHLVRHHLHTSFIPIFFTMSTSTSFSTAQIPMGRSKGVVTFSQLLKLAEEFKLGRKACSLLPTMGAGWSNWWRPEKANSQHAGNLSKSFPICVGSC